LSSIAGRDEHDPWQAQGVLTEDERMADGSIARLATVFLTGQECPWRCLMRPLAVHDDGRYADRRHRGTNRRCGRHSPMSSA
jgi:hypothetical protein